MGREFGAMAMACGNRLASSLLQDGFTSSGVGRGDVRRVSSSAQLRQGSGVLRKTCRVPAFSPVRVCCVELTFVCFFL